MKENRVKRSVGRPKTEPKTKWSVSILDSIAEPASEAAEVLFDGNRSEYINSLIKKDLAENGETYQRILALKNQ